MKTRVGIFCDGNYIYNVLHYYNHSQNSSQIRIKLTYLRELSKEAVNDLLKINQAEPNNIIYFVKPELSDRKHILEVINFEGNQNSSQNKLLIAACDSEMEAAYEIMEQALCKEFETVFLVTNSDTYSPLVKLLRKKNIPVVVLNFLPLDYYGLEGVSRSLIDEEILFGINEELCGEASGVALLGPDMLE